MVRTFLHHLNSIGSAVRRRGGQLLLTTALLLCVWTMTTPALGAQTQASYDYLFEVTTGAKTGDEEKIDFFIITYTTENSGEKTVSKFLFPSKDGWDQTYEKVTAVNNAQAQRDRAIQDTYGYAGAELKSGRKIFQAYSTDQYLFTTPEEIREVKRIQVFASDSGSWDCRALRVFKVDTLGGLYRSNVASRDCYIDFEGDLIAEGKSTGTNVAWQNDKLISTGVDLTLSTASALNSAYAHHSLQDGTQKTLAIRFDFADTYGAGLESLSAMSASANKLSNMGLAETMAVTLYYEDIYGLRHEVNVPAVLNAAEYASGLLSSSDRSKAISGFAQQGESMVIGVFLPDFAALVPSEGLKVTLGAEEVKGVLGLTTANDRPTGEARTQRASRITLSESDAASFVTMAVYDLSKTRVEASVNDTSGVIRYRYIGGDPLYYQQVSTVSGNPLDVGENKLSLTTFESGKSSLAPRDKTERYLLELTTDSVTGAGTKDDILMSISWTDLEGNAKVSGTLNVRELSRDFNGWWYGTVSRNGSAESGPQDIAYLRGVATGQTLRFFVPLQNVKAINDVRVWMSESGSRDDWQMKDLKISTVNSFDRRAVSWRAVNVDGVSSVLTFDRAVEGTLVYQFSETAENPVLVQQDSDDMTNVGPSRTDNIKSGETGGGSVDVTETKKVDWSQLRYAMSFKDASQDLGFGKQRYLYAVTVHVGGNEEASAEDGDCGSKNLFYFRLIFKSGSSSFVLANQQLSSDGFIAGASQTFYIGTNQDYGDVTAVQIIPEDMSSDSDMFDKLNIKSIDIKRESSSALVPVWTVSQVGWISIDYRDEGQLQSVTGMAGRGASELTRTYLVDGSTFDVNFMLSITTESYDGDPQFEGNLSAIVYYDSYSPSKGYAEISDVTKSMYSYMNRTPIGMPESIGGKTISDPGLMFRSDHTDRFYFSLSDVRSINRIELQAVSAVNTTWNISDVSLYMVNGQGSLILNQFGEYQRIYKAGEQLTELAHGTSDSSPAYHQILQAYDGTTNSRGEKVNDRAAVIRVSFTENNIEITPEAKQWTSVVSKEPASENDTLNVFLYPLEGTRVDTAYNPVTILQYTNSKSDAPIQKSTGDMTRALYNDRPVFYTTGINASNLSALKSAVIRTTRGSGIQGDVRAVVQQIRSGVVIRTWELSGTGYSDMGIVLGTGSAVTTQRQQRVQLQLGTDTKKAALSDTGNNLAVALWYRCDDPSGMELRSPYIYLTDQDYSKIEPGQIIELTFNQKNIAEITGIVLVSMGDATGSVEMARVVDEEIGVETGVVMDTVGEYGFTTPARISSAPSRTAPGGNVKPLTLTFVTGAPAEGESEGGGTDAPVRVTLGYYNEYGEQISRTYDNIQLYLGEDGTAFTTGSTRTAELLVEDIQQLRWIELEPRHDSGVESASWTLASIGAAVGDSGTGTDRTVNTIIREGAPLTVVFANVSLKLTATTTVDDEVTVKETIGGEEKILTKSKGTVVIAPQLTGSTSGWRVVAERVVDGFPASASSTIRINRDGDVEFTAPENKTGSAVQYRITVTSIESPDVKAVMNIGVESEPEPEPVVTPTQQEGGSGTAGGGTSSDTAGESSSGAADSGATEVTGSGETVDTAGDAATAPAGETGADTTGDSAPASGDAATAPAGETGADTTEDIAPASGDEISGTSDEMPSDTGTEAAGSGDTGTDSEEG